jgi:hypothetical protein
MLQTGMQVPLETQGYSLQEGINPAGKAHNQPLRSLVLGKIQDCLLMFLTSQPRFHIHQAGAYKSQNGFIRCHISLGIDILDDRAQGGDIRR